MKPVDDPTTADVSDTRWRLSFPYVAVPILVLALGHTLSNLVRTLPAISADLIAQDLAVSAGEIAAMTGFYHLAFALGQIPVGVALDRYSVRSVISVLLGIVAIGSVAAAFVNDPTTFILAQALLGIGTSGMLLCPLSYAARNTDPRQFAVWSAVILAVGNSGMLITASPMAWVIEHYGWHVAFGLPAAAAILVVLIVQIVIAPDAPLASKPATIWREVKEVGRIGTSPTLRGVVVLAFVSFAVMIGVRGMWGGPWLMDAKGMSRLAAGNVLLLLTLMLMSMPLVIGLIEKRVGRPDRFLTIGHVMAGLCLVALPFGAREGFMTGLPGAAFPPNYDILLIVAFGVLISVQPLLFALGRASVSSQHAGKALAAVNLAFFAGAACIQMLSAPVANISGLSGVLVFLGALSIVAALMFRKLTARAR